MIASTRNYSCGLRQGRHAHETMSVTIVLSGSLAERVGQVEERARPLSLVIKPAEVPHETRFGPAGARTVQLVLDPEEAEELGRAQPATREWRWIHGGGGHLVGPFLELARALCASDDAPVDLAAVDTLAGLDCLTPSRAEPPPVIRIIQSRLDDDPEPPRAGQLAREAGMHPVYLARLFRRYTGTTMSRYRRQSQVRRVIDRLETGSRLSRTAYEAGFADHAHMCRAFRAETSLTPSQYRVLLTA